jgi:cellulose synthase operon protein C
MASGFGRGSEGSRAVAVGGRRARPRSVVALAAVVVAGALAAAPAAAAPGPLPPSFDPRHLDELAQDVARFQEAVRGYRTAASTVIRRTYNDKLRSIRGKYDPLIALNEKEERERRLDAIAMFETFLRKYPTDKRWTPDAMFRLAELYYEKSSDEFLTAQEAYQKALDSPTPPTEQPKADYGKTVALYQRLLTEFPNYRLGDAAYYLLGFCLGEMGQDAEAKQALLALTCSNKYKAFDPPAAAPAGGTAPAASSRAQVPDPYKDCRPLRKDSKFVPEAWTRVGEMHFDAGELPPAISAYTRVLEYKDSSYYDKALYKLAWSYYRDNRFPEAIREFDNLVKFADERKASGDKFGSELRPEAIQYLAISFSEPDWDGDTLPDADTGLARATAFYKGRDAEPHVREVFQRLGDIYFDSTKYNEAVAVYRATLSRWPFYVEAPKIQNKIVTAYERDRNLVAAAKEREALGRNYNQSSEWYRQNRENPDALVEAQQLAEDALLIAATNVHTGAQACKDGLATEPARAAECKAMYQTAAELYEKYLAAYPNSKRAYEFSFFYAEALYFSDQLPRAIAAYTTVRDSNLDNKYQQDAAIRIIKAHEDLIERMKAAKQIEEPPLPEEKNTTPPVVALAMPDVYQQYVKALDWYTTNLRDDRVPDLRYAAAVAHLRYRNWPEARARLASVGDAYCASKPEIGFRAYEAMIKTYFIDFEIQDEEQKDCALGRLLQVADRFAESACGKNPAGAEYLARVNQIRTSVRSTVITKRLQIALENEEKGTDRQLTQCRDGAGGIALVTGTAPQPGTPATPGQPARPTGGTKLSTEVDQSLALDLLDLVNQNPRDADAPTNLNNACVIYEKLYQYGEATKCYERLARDYPDSRLALDAVWNAARNHLRFFEFNEAVAGYVKVATDPKFEGYEHRREALGQAAMLLDNDQQYARAAQMYRRYSDSNADKPRDAAQAHLFACTAHEKANDTRAQSQCLRDLIARYRTVPEAGEFVVEAYLRQAVIAEKSGDRRATAAAYQRARDEFISRRLAPATPAAAAAAKAEYLLLEDRFNAFKNRQLVLRDQKSAKRVLDNFMNEAKSLQAEYQRVWDYKDATWTLASMLKRGDIFYEFAQKLLKAADNPPDEIKRLERQACRADPNLCGVAETEYKDAILSYVTPVEDEAKKQWRSTLERASQLGVTNEYVKKARENLSKYLPEEFPFVKDERPQIEYP